MINATTQTRKKTSTGVKLIQAAALAAVLVPLGSVAVETSTCGYGGSGSGAPCSAGLHEGGLMFDFGVGGSAPYKVELAFDEVNGPFVVTINDDHHTYEEMIARFVTNFAGYQPVPLDPLHEEPSDPLDPLSPLVSKPYIDFQISAPDPGPTTWSSLGPGEVRGQNVELGYNVWIYWLNPTDPPFSNPKVLHDTDGGSNQFDTDMTVDGSYSTDVPCGVFTPCPPPDGCGDVCIGEFGPTDPAIGGRDDVFTSITVGDAAVPEPTTMVLLGTGISGLLYRRRQRRHRAETPPSL